MNNNQIKKQLSAAYRYSYSALALNYFSFYEMMDSEEHKSDTLNQYAARFHKLLHAFLQGEDCSGDLDDLRNDVLEMMEIITAYTDCFQIYEYVLNRMERTYKMDMPPVEELEDFVPELIQFLLKPSDSFTTNLRVQMVIGQLPVRYTRQKFYSLLMERLSVYLGSDKQSLEDRMYLLRTESMVHLPAGMQTEYEELYRILEQFRSADYLHMEEDQYQEYQSRISQVSSRLEEDSDAYLLLQDNINSLYVLLLAQPEAMIDVSEKQLLEKIVSSVLNGRFHGNTSITEDEITDMLYELEGWQESSMERYLSYPGTDSLDEDPLKIKIRKVDKLLSGSSFVSLEECTDEEEPLEQATFEKQVSTYCEELDEIFAGSSKPVVRAIMAKVLSLIPTAFRSVEDLTEYVTRSLESCTNMAERETSIELLKFMMETEDALV